MRLFHYTGLDHVAGIRAQGLTLGGLCVPTHGDIFVKFGYQWLTDDADWQQGWATNHAGMCDDRTAARFTVVIPKSARHRLWHWPLFARSVLGMDEYLLREFNRAGGSDDGAHWYVFKGVVPSGWFRQLEYRDIGGELEESDGH